MSQDSEPQDDLPQESEAPQAEAPQEVPQQAPQPDQSRSRVDAFFHQPLTRIQALVGVFAGLITISGSVVSMVGLTHHADVHGEMIALIQDARLKKPVAAAMVEILTPQNAVVTTLTAPSDGRVTRRLKEGKYRVRFTHPEFVTEVRQIEVSAGDRSEIRVALAPRAHAPAVVTTHAAPPHPPEPIAITPPRASAPAPTKPSPVAARAELKRAEPVNKAEPGKKTESVKKAAEPAATRQSQFRESP
jgi:Carboxypeptidase regulatory-like domain